MVLLKNEGGVLPLDAAKKTAVIGPLAKNQHDMLGPVVGPRRRQRRRHRFRRHHEQSPGATYAEGCKLSNGEVPSARSGDVNCGSRAGCAIEDIAAAHGRRSGRARPGRDARDERRGDARSKLDLPGRQEELIQAVKASGKPFAVVLFSGRPLALEDIVADAPALLEAWFPGVQAGPAVADVVFGKVNPGGKLPVSFPYRVGQVPIYYNHVPAGRPCNKDDQVELAAP